MKLFISILFSCFLITCMPAIAQEVSQLNKVTEQMKLLRESYDTRPVSFDLRYVYSNEHTPADILDSLSGNIIMDSTNYRCILDNTETISNGKYNIILFKEDQVMYLSKGTATNATQDPLQTIQTVLEKSGASGCTITNNKRNKVIHIDFVPGGACKQIEMVIDTVARRLLSMEYIVRTSQLMEIPGATGSEQPEGYEEFARVRADFYNYRFLLPDKSRFDERTFFYKEGDTFKTTAAYSSYKIFIATPNL